jgi:two-component system, OmpR family, response regulator ChvI
VVRILVVDDENDSLLVFTLMLRAEGYIVDSYNDPIKALTAFMPSHYDLIILDYRMAGLNGLGFIQEIRKLDNSAKAILLTAWLSLGDEVKKYFMKVLAKPISEEKLIEEVRLALGKY